MPNSITRRRFSQNAALALGSAALINSTGLLADAFSKDQLAPFRTPYKYGKLVLAASTDAQAFDSKAVDDPFVFFHDGAFRMLYIGFDGTGYQSGLARSTDLLHWERIALVAPRDPNSKYTRYNVALSCLLREEGLTTKGSLKKVQGRYLGAWHAYPNPGYEEGAAVIGLAWSDNLLHWELTEPILFPADGAPWEHGGLYRPNLVEHDGLYYLYYNAKTDRPRTRKDLRGTNKPAWLLPRIFATGPAIKEIPFCQMEGLAHSTRASQAIRLWFVIRTYGACTTTGWTLSSRRGNSSRWGTTRIIFQKQLSF